MKRAAGWVLLLALVACAKDSRNNSVWLAVKNETGGRLSDFVMDYGAGQRRYQIFEAGYTFGGYSRVRGPQSVSISYTDGEGARRAPEVRLVLEPNLIGDRVLITLRPDHSAEFRVDEVTKRRPSPFNSLEDYERWFQGAAVVILLPLLILGIRKLRHGASTVKTAVTNFFANPARDGAVAALGLTYQVCPVRMFTMDPDDPISWYQGVLDGRMLGLLDHGRLWVGNPDEVTVVAFKRRPDGAFEGRDFTERQDNPLLRDEKILSTLAAFSPAVHEVGILAGAVEASFDWKRATAEHIVSDAKALSALRSHVDTYDPPLVRAVFAGDEVKVRALLASGVDVEAVTLGYVSALVAAAMLGRAELVRALIGAGARPQPEHGWPLFEAARRGHLDVVKVLVEAGVPAGMTGGWGGTALHEAATGGHADIVAYLLARGCDPHIKNKDGGTALGYARYGKHARVVELLTAAGAK